MRVEIIFLLTNNLKLIKGSVNEKRQMVKWLVCTLLEWFDTSYIFQFFVLHRHQVSADFCIDFCNQRCLDAKVQLGSNLSISLGFTCFIVVNIKQGHKLLMFWTYQLIWCVSGDLSLNHGSFSQQPLTKPELNMNKFFEDKLVWLYSKWLNQWKWYKIRFGVKLRP